MALRLVRQTSETPNITNKDDTIMTRYAYGGYNGIVKGFGSECGYTAENGIFKVLSGRICVDGWEIDVDGTGWQLNLSNVSGIQYYSIYAEINVLVESVEIKSTYSLSSYPIIEKGDDLTSIPNGTARLLLYNVKVSNGSITEVLTKFSKILNLSDVVNELKNGSIVVDKAKNSENATKVNNLEIKSVNDVLKIGDKVISQKRLLWSSTQGVAPTEWNVGVQICEASLISGKRLEVQLRNGQTVRFKSAAIMPVSLPLPKDH